MLAPELLSDNHGPSAAAEGTFQSLVNEEMQQISARETARLQFLGRGKAAFQSSAREDRQHFSHRSERTGSIAVRSPWHATPAKRANSVLAQDGNHIHISYGILVMAY